MPVVLPENYSGDDLRRAADQLLTTRGYQCEGCGAGRRTVSVGKLPKLNVRPCLVRDPAELWRAPKLAMMCERCHPDAPVLMPNQKQIARLSGDLFTEGK